MPSSGVAQRQEQPNQSGGFTKGTSSEGRYHHGLDIYVKRDGGGEGQGGGTATGVWVK